MTNEARQYVANYNNCDMTEKEVFESSEEKGFHLEDNSFKVAGWGYRHTQCAILFVSLTIAYSMRSCMGVALVAMVQKDEANLPLINITSLYNRTDYNETVKHVTGNITEDFRVEGFFHVLMLVPPYPYFKWNKRIQDTILSSFFWGYMLLQIPAGQLAHKFGARRLLIGAMMINCIIPFILPIAAYHGGWIFTVICRIGQGLSQACIIPSLHTFLGKWAPLEERGRLLGIIYGGQALGTVLGLPITGFIASSPLGWPGIFRFYGLLSGATGFVIWYVLADTPAQHAKISMEERRYIEEALGQTGRKKHLSVPWKKILTCRGTWAIVLAHIAHTWGHLTLFSELPSYMDKIMGLDLKANGLLTALPFMVMWIINYFFSWLADMLIVKKYFTVTHARKFMNSLGSVPTAIGLVALAYAPKNIYIVEALLVVICSFKIAAVVGFYVSPVDMAPNFAGTLISISNFSANVVSSLSPIIASVILTDVTDAHLWRKVFFVTSGMYFFTNVVYVIFGTSEPAEWNDPPQYEEVPFEDKNKDDDNIEKQDETANRNNGNIV